MFEHPDNKVAGVNHDPYRNPTVLASLQMRSSDCSRSSKTLMPAATTATNQTRPSNQTSRFPASALGQTSRFAFACTQSTEATPRSTPKSSRAANNALVQICRRLKPLKPVSTS